MICFDLVWLESQTESKWVCGKNVIVYLWVLQNSDIRARNGPRGLGDKALQESPAFRRGEVQQDISMAY
jgi:hypothetical protein